MQEEVRVVLDAMGGDHAPEEMIKGAVEAVNEKNNIHVLLVGQEDVISEELEKYTYPKERMEIVHASEVIETAEPPVMAIRILQAPFPSSVLPVLLRSEVRCPVFLLK